MLKKLFTIVKEYGVIWTCNRALYEVKLCVLRKCPQLQFLFEREVSVERIDLLDVDVWSIKEFLNQLSQEQKEHIIKMADNAINGTIEAFGKTEFKYGFPINWQLNPVTGKCCDKTKEWFFISDFNKDTGDIKNIWELSRFSHMYYLVRAFLLTEEKKYYGAFSQQLSDWIENNEYGKGANYKCGQECSIRMVNALIVYTAFNNLGVTSQKDEENIRKLIELSYKKIKGNFFYAHRCVKIDHLIAESCGLVTGAWCCGKTNVVRKYGKLIMREIKKQFSGEGLYQSYSFHYQRYVMEWMEYVYKISPKVNFAVDEKVEEILYKAARLLGNVSGNDGLVPNYGSNDGTLIFKVTSCEHNDFRPVISTIMLLTGHGKIFPDGVYDEEWLWFGDNRGINEEKESKFNLKKELYVFENGSAKVMLNAHNYKTRPAHMDQMHIELWIDGIEVFGDSGSYSYADEIGDLLTLTRAHNTVCLDNKNQFIRNGRFLTYGKPKVKVSYVDDKIFDGCVKFVSGYSHRRRIEMAAEGVLIDDWVIASETDNCEIRFHTPCEVKINGKEISFWYQERRMCTLSSEAEEITVEEVKRSSYYMSLEDIKCVRLKMDKRNCRTTILLR